MKKKLQIALFLFLIAAFVVAFAACGNKPETPPEEEQPPVSTDCTHSYGEWVPQKEATCTEAGSKTKTCSLCQDVQTEVIEATGHKLTDCVCDNCGVTTHTVNDECVCTVCGATDHSAKVNEQGFCRHNSNAKEIYFGSYPQSKVTGQKLTTVLTRMAGDLPTDEDSKGWTSYNYYIRGRVDNYMWYIDKEYCGSKFRGVFFSYYRPEACNPNSNQLGSEGSKDKSQQDENGYNVNNVYWFKFEPIKWRVLEERIGTAFLLADVAIDSQQYYHEDYNDTKTRNEKEVYANNYAESEIRQWLNATFYNTAFNDLQKELIEVTEVDNSLESTGDDSHDYACENTKDKVFLLSYQEAINTVFGFSSRGDQPDVTRSAQATDYAKCQGCLKSSENTCYWWLRSPNADEDPAVYYVGGTGKMNDYDYVDNTNNSVRPALKITVSKK